MKVEQNTSVVYKAGKGVVLRQRLLKNGTYSLFLDIHPRSGKRFKEFLNIYYNPLLERSKDYNERNYQRELLIRAKKIADEKALLINDPSKFRDTISRKIIFIEYFELIAKQKNIKTRKHSWEAGLKHLKYFLEEIHEEKVTLNDFSEEHIEKFIDFLKPKIGNTTIESYIAKISTCLNIAVKKKLISTNPIIYVTNKVKRDEPKIIFLTEEERDLIMNSTINVNQVVKKAFIFSCFTGLRLSDIENLEWKNISNGYITTKQQKTGATVYIPLIPKAKAILDSLSQSNEKVFVNMPARSTVKRVMIKFRSLLKNGKKISYHSSRHTFATTLLSKGGNIVTIRDLMGHKTIEMTLRYAKVLNTDAKATINLL